MSRRHAYILVRADEDEDDCLTAAADAFVVDHPDLDGCDLKPRWADDADREWVVLTVPLETAEAVWWDWHDGDSDRASPTVEEADARARAWALGESDDGPSHRGMSLSRSAAEVVS